MNAVCCIFFKIKADGIEPAVLEIRVGRWHSVYVGELAEMISREDTAVFYSCRKRVHTDTHFDIRFFHFEKISRRNPCIPVTAEAGDEFEFLLHKLFICGE